MAIINEIHEEEPAAATMHDVFLSFRGEDTRLGFVDHLHQALVNDNISTFLDDKEVETGEELKPELARAIKGSRASIIVLSKNYASSTWCLDELVMILEQRRLSNHIVLPIFYNVDPSHVRKQESTFGDALFEHERRVETEKDEEKKIEGACKLEMWRKALTEVADLKGKDVTGRRETLFIEEIVKEISTKLEPHLQMRNIRHLYGVDDLISSISSWLKRGSSENAEILTIFGMPGIGKTTLAKHMYMKHRHEFERSSFVEGIGRRCPQQTCKQVLDLQNQLLGDILKRKNIEEHDEELSRSKIAKALLRRKTLLVLDDVEKINELDMLIGTKGFYPGSKIILTTKDMSLTEKSLLFRMPLPPKHTMLPLNRLSDTESLKLLCWHAFGNNDPTKGFEKEAQRIAEYCEGHPLALEVLGRSLINEDVAIWSDVVELLDAEGYLKDVKKLLRISFDSLPENCKELFKHIACFFVGTDIIVADTILEGCGIKTSSGFKKLFDRCLLTIGKFNVLAMHQLIQDMGRDLICEESLHEPWMRSRVWNHEQSLNLLKEDKATDKTQGLMLDMNLLGKEHTDDDHKINFGVVQPIHVVYIIFLRIWLFFARLFQMPSSSHDKKKVELRTDVFRKMNKLKLLQLNHVNVNGSYEMFPKGLIWLCMHGFQSKCIPSDLPVDNLVALDMSHSKLTHLWKKKKLLGSLKILNLSYCKRLGRVEHFSGLCVLERLILRSCESLVHVCESIGGCDSLVILDMTNCTKLSTVPIIISKLKNVRLLSLEGCLGAGEFLMRVSDMESYASSSFIAKFVPKSPKSFVISLPSSLVTLSLRDNNLSSESFPKDLSSMSMLRILRLDGNPIDSLPDCVKSLGRLEVLYVGRCSMLKSVMCPSPKIRHLLIQHCANLEKITFPQEMTTLPIVYFKDTVSLTEIQGIMKIQVIARVEDQVFSSLGWADIEHVKDLKMQIWDAGRWPIAKKLPLFYEFGIFSTCFPGKEVPEWLAQKSNGSSVSLTMPSSSLNKTIVGINICFVHTFLGTGIVSSLRIKVTNVTKNRMWIYYGYMFAVREFVDEDIVWLSHWMFGNNEIEDGDEVSVAIVEEEEDGGIMVRECAISPVYNDGDKNEEDPLSYYKSWKRIIGGDLSDFQLTSGDYFLIHDRFFYPRYYFEELFEHKTTQNLVGYTPQYKDDDANKRGISTYVCCRPTKSVMVCEVKTDVLHPSYPH